LGISPNKEKHASAIKSRKNDESQRGDIEATRSKEETIVDAIEKKLQLEKLVKEADIENARDLFVGKGNTMIRGDRGFLF
jgi:hypothetical protein